MRNAVSLGERRSEILSLQQPVNQFRAQVSLRAFLIHPSEAASSALPQCQFSDSGPAQKKSHVSSSEPPTAT